MTLTPLKEQFKEYKTLFLLLFFDYYKQQKKAFWIIQLLIIVALFSSIGWILSVFLGLSFHQNPGITEGLKYQMFSWLNDLPIWQWLILTTFIGVLSAIMQYFSVQTGVQSVLGFQKHLNYRCLEIVENKHNKLWPVLFDQTPQAALIRVTKLGVQLCGLVARRMARSFIEVFIFIFSLIVLIVIDYKLLALLTPIASIYIITLYKINKNTKNVSQEMLEQQPSQSKKYSHLINQLLNKKVSLKQKKFIEAFNDSGYMHQAHLRYKRRLAEVHVDWLNTIALVFGITAVVIYEIYLTSPANIPWQKLLIFLLVLKYAAQSLNNIAAMTVAFSRFYPEIKLVYKLLLFKADEHEIKKVKLNGDTLILQQSSNLNDFDLELLEQMVQVEKQASIIPLQKVREIGIQKFFKSKEESHSSQSIIICHHLNGLKRMIENHKANFESHFMGVHVLESYGTLKLLSFDEFIEYEPNIESDEDLLL